MSGVNGMGRLGLAAVVLLAVGTVVHAQGEPLTIFDWEGGLQDWTIPDWAKDKEDNAGRIVSTSKEVASHGVESLQVLADFPGTGWSSAYVEVPMRVSDWSQFSSVSVDVYIPANAPKGLQVRFILTVGEKWDWTEMNHAIPLEPGKWVTLTANIKAGSLDWKFFPTESFRKDVRKLGLRAESDKQPAYSGPVYFDNLRLSP